MHKVWQQVRWYTLVVIIATFVCIPLPGSANPQTTAEPAEPKAKTPPPVGQCASPHNSIHTLLVHLQDDDKYNPGRASACISREGLGKPADAPRLAIKFKKVLDARGLYVVLDDLPNVADYTDEKGQHKYVLFPKSLPEMTYELVDDRWLLNEASRERILALYRDTFPFELDEFVAGLPEVFRKRIIGIQVWQYLCIILIVLLATTVRSLTLIVFRRVLTRLLNRFNQPAWLRDAVLAADSPVGLLVFAGTVTLVFPLLMLPAVITSAVIVAMRVISASSLVWLGFRFTDSICEFFAERAKLTDSKLDDQLVPLARKVLKAFITVIGGIFVLQNLNVDVDSLLATLGIGGLAIALAAKDTAANLFGSVMIFLDKPFQIGEAIKIGNHVEGTVEEVGFRSTRVRTFYNSLVSFPNALITNSTIDNLGMRQYRRYKTTLGLTYDTPPEKVQAFCEGVRAIIASQPGMRHDFYIVEFEGFGPHSLDILLYSFMDVADWNEELRVRTNLNLAIMRLARELHVEFAFPTQTLHVHQEANAEATPATPEELEGIIKKFAPGGTLHLPNGITISPGYEPKKDGA